VLSPLHAHAADVLHLRVGHDRSTEALSCAYPQPTLHPQISVFVSPRIRRWRYLSPLGTPGDPCHTERKPPQGTHCRPISPDQIRPRMRHE
jgi:hypothetical protein